VTKERKEQRQRRPVEVAHERHADGLERVLLLDSELIGDRRDRFAQRQIAQFVKRIDILRDRI